MGTETVLIQRYDTKGNDSGRKGKMDQRIQRLGPENQERREDPTIVLRGHKRVRLFNHPTRKDRDRKNKVSPRNCDSERQPNMRVSVVRLGI